MAAFCCFSVFGVSVKQDMFLSLGWPSNLHEGVH